MPAYYLSKTNRTTTPTRLVSFATDSKEGQCLNGNGTVPREFCRVWARYTERRRGEWGADHAINFARLKDWWEWIQETSHKGTLLYLISPTCIDDLTLLNVWEEIDSGRLKMTTPDKEYADEETGEVKTKKGFRYRLIASNPPDILSLMGKYGPIKCLSLKNYITSNLLEVAKRFGVHVLSRPRKGERSLIRGIGGEEAAAVTSAAFKGLTDWWRDGECGPWRDTVSQLSMSLYKTHWLDERVFIHKNPEAQQLERAGMFGARISAWYFGDIGKHPGTTPQEEPPPDRSRYKPEPGPTWKLDVRSQYPFLLSKMPFPTVLMGTFGESPVEYLAALVKLWGVVAAVRLKTSKAEYPLRGKRWVTYPVGEFDTVLTGPELERALSENAITRVYRGARYELSRCFEGYANWLWKRRSDCERAGDTVGAEWTKLVGTAFAGKLAQRPPRWVDTPKKKPRHRWGAITVIDADSGEVWTERGIAGHRQERNRSTESNAVAPAAFAYLTAYGRCMMRELRELAGAVNVYAQHTDCLWVNEVGYEKLVTEGKVAPEDFGGLKDSGPYTYCRFLTPAHRYTDGVWAVGGITDGFTALPHARFRVDVYENQHRNTMPGKRGTVRRRREVRDLSEIEKPHGVDRRGWAVPFIENSFTEWVKKTAGTAAD